MPIGSWELVRDGEDVAFLAVGTMVGPAVEAAERLAKRGVSAAVANCRFVKPLDREMLLRLRSQCDVLVTLEEGNLPGGFGAGILETLDEEGLSLDGVIRLGLPDGFVTHGSREQLLEDVHGHIVFFFAAGRAGFHVKGSCAVLSLQISLEYLLDVLPDHQRVDPLQIRHALEENDARDDLVRVVHLLDGLFALLLGELGEAPIVEQAIVQPVLIDGAELKLQRFVQGLDDLFVAFHSAPPCLTRLLGGNN